MFYYNHFVRFCSTDSNYAERSLYRYLEQYANLADLKQFYQINLPQAANSTLQVELINGAHAFLVMAPM